MKRFLVLAIAALVLVHSTGCYKIALKTEYPPGKILILPPRDVVQKGKPHPVGVGSGAMLQTAVAGYLSRTPFTPVFTTSDRFNGVTVANWSDAMEEAKRLETDYVLQLVLGEFQDARPTGWGVRQDFVFLNEGTMLKVPGGEVCWKLRMPYEIIMGEYGNYQYIIERMGRNVGKSISVDQPNAMNLGQVGIAPAAKREEKPAAGEALRDELHLADGKVVKCRLVKLVPGEGYTVRLEDGREVTYPEDQVESLKHSK